MGARKHREGLVLEGESERAAIQNREGVVLEGESERAAIQNRGRGWY